MTCVRGTHTNAGAIYLHIGGLINNFCSLSALVRGIRRFLICAYLSHKSPTKAENVLKTKTTQKNHTHIYKTTRVVRFAAAIGERNLCARPESAQSVRFENIMLLI